MQRFFQRWFWWVTRCLLRLRYRVEVQGGERLQDLAGPTIVMPNHPGYIDPALVLTHVRLRDPLRPLVYTGTYRNPVLYPVMRAIGSVEVPELAAQSRQAKQTTLDMIERVAAAVGRGESILIYPSGRLQREGFEVVGASRAAAELLRACPEANVVLVRTRGVWGSMFSWGRTASAPHLGSCIVRGLLWALANLLFFLPRRCVTMTIEIVPRSDLPDATREQLNPFLEEWYNRDGRETPTYVPLPLPVHPPRLRVSEVSTPVGHRFRQDQGRHPQCGGRDGRGAPAPAVDRRGTRRADHAGPIGFGQLGPNGFGTDDRTAVWFPLGSSGRHAGRVVGRWAEGLLTGDGSVRAKPCRRFGRASTPAASGPSFWPARWPKRFVRRVRANPDDVAVADRLSGVLTYRRMLVGASLMSKRFARFEGDAVGVLLPSSVAADLVFFALHFAGKLPVMLNWTTGPANLAHAVQTMNIRHVVTSRRFVDRLGVEIERNRVRFPGGSARRDRTSGSSPDAGPLVPVDRFVPEGRAARGRGRPGRGAVHLGIGSSAQGGAVVAPQSAGRYSSGHRGDGIHAAGRPAGVLASVPQLRAGRQSGMSRADRHPRRPSCRPDRRARAGAKRCRNTACRCCSPRRRFSGTCWREPPRRISARSGSS
jgi:1-acyl-sn-glycerol-3-phosphate acyltransferase